MNGFISRMKRTRSSILYSIILPAPGKRISLSQSSSMPLKEGGNGVNAGGSVSGSDGHPVGKSQSGVRVMKAGIRFGQLVYALLDIFF